MSFFKLNINIHKKKISHSLYFFDIEKKMGY